MVRSLLVFVGHIATVELEHTDTHTHTHSSHIPHAATPRGIIILNVSLCINDVRCVMCVICDLGIALMYSTIRFAICKFY